MRRSSSMAVTALAILFTLTPVLRAQQNSQVRREAMRQVREQLQKTFEADQEAKIPLSELSLPEQMKARLDSNQDGWITWEEARRLLERSDRNQPLSRLRILSEEGGYPMNLNPEIVTAAEAGLGDSDLVMGVVLQGQARAYPVNYMNGPTNEVVNDVLGETPIAPSW